MSSPANPAPPPQSASDPAAKAPVKLSGPVAILVLLAIPLAILILWKSFPLNLWLLGCFVPWVIVHDERYKDKVWARPLQALLGPALAALAILSTFVAFLKLFDFRSATAIANGEDLLILKLHSWLKHPTFWEYLFLLAAATLISWRFPRLKTVGRLKSARDWLGTAAGIIAVMANVSFLGQQQVVSDRYQVVESNIEAQYRNADEEKIRHVDQALAAEALTQDLHSADSEDMASMRNCLAALASLDLPRDYRDAVARSLADKVSPDAESESPFNLEIDIRASHDANAISSVAPGRQIAAVEKARQDATDARRQESDAQAGLRTIVTTLIGKGNGKVADAAMSLFDPLVRGLGLEILAPVTDALQDQATDSVKDWLKDREKPLVDRAVAQAGKALHWDQLPHAPPEQLAASFRETAIAVAQQRRAAAADDLNKIVDQAKSGSVDPNVDPGQDIADAKAQGIEADQVLHQLGATQSGGNSLQPPQDPAVVWDLKARPAENAVTQFHQRAQAEEKSSEAGDRNAEPR